MSHFTVLVIGEDPEGQLAKYSEHIEAEPYFVESVSEEDQSRFLEHYECVDMDKAYPLKGEDWNGNCWRKCEGGWEEWSTYNQDSKWDWYLLGGRWTGYLKLKEKAIVGVVGKPGLMTDPAEQGYADRAYKKDVDFEFMRNKSGKEAEGKYDSFHAILDGRTFLSWSTVRESHEDINDAREAYRVQPVIVDLRNSDDFKHAFFSREPEDYLVRKDKFIQTARDSAVSSYALVKNGEWYQKGEMGWFGMSSEEMTENEWNKKFSDLLDDLTPDTVLSLYDCHI